MWVRRLTIYWGSETVLVGNRIENRAEIFEDKPPAPQLDEGDNAVGELGCGKCRKQPNQLYVAVWRHNDSDTSEHISYFQTSTNAI